MAGLYHSGPTLASIGAAKDHSQECGPRNAFTASHLHFACRWRKFKYVLDCVGIDCVRSAKSTDVGGPVSPSTGPQ